MDRLAGKTALIVGATSGIGAECARLFAAEGCQVVVAGRRVELGEQVVKEIVDKGGQACYMSVDAQNEGEVEKVVAETVARYGKLDIAVNTPGGAPFRFIVDTPGEEWREIMDLNLNSMFYCIKHQARQMKKNGGGSIINMSSYTAQAHSITLSGYCTAKAALNVLTKVAAMELGVDHIRVNAILPGYVLTERVAARVQNEEINKDVLFRTPTRKLSTPLDVAYMTLFLASDESANITAGEFLVDGGSVTRGYPEAPHVLLGLPRTIE